MSISVEVTHLVICFLHFHRNGAARFSISQIRLNWALPNWYCISKKSSVKRIVLVLNEVVLVLLLDLYDCNEISSRSTSTGRTPEYEHDLVDTRNDGV